MKRIAFSLVALLTMAGIVAARSPVPGRDDGGAVPIFGIKIFPGYRDWRLISVAHEEGSLNDIRAILGNDVAITAYRKDKLPFPDGTVIARIAWKDVPSEENNKVFGRAQSFVADPLRSGTCSLWSRTQKSSQQRPAGGSLNLTKTANLPTRRSSKLASLAISHTRLGTSSSLITPDRS
jgi:Cytochrome P460